MDRPPIAAPKFGEGIRALETKDRPAPIAKAANPVALNKVAKNPAAPICAAAAPAAVASPAIIAVAILLP